MVVMASIAKSTSRKSIYLKKGGLGIKNIKNHNLALLDKWAWWLINNIKGTWKSLIYGFYFKRSNLSACWKPERK